MGQFGAKMGFLGITQVLELFLILKSFSTLIYSLIIYYWAAVQNPERSVAITQNVPKTHDLTRQDDGFISTKCRGS
jgi:hypothetical protein